MKLLKVRARGFIGFRDGMGCDEIDVDLSGLHGLVGLSGDNGRGKTTFLEVCSPFRTLASRKGKLNDHVFLRDSFKEITFEFAGDEYRCLVKIDSGSTRSEGFIYKNGISEINGKVTEYDSYITDLIGSQSLFYASVFCAQNSQKLSDMRPGEIKELFVEFLQIKKYEEWERTAKMAGAFLAGQSKSIEDEIFRLTRNANAVNDISDSIKELERTLADTVDSITDEEFDLSLVRDHRDNIQQDKITNELMLARKKELFEKIESLSAQISSEMAIFDKSRSDITIRIDAIGHKRKEYEGVLKSKNAILESEKTLADKKSTIKDFEGKKSLIEGGINGCRSDFDEVTKEISELKSNLQADTDIYFKKSSELSSRKNILTRELDSIKQSLSNPPASKIIQALERDLDYHKKQVSSFDGIDPNCSSQACRFILEANESRSKIPSIEMNLQSEKEKMSSWSSDISNSISKKETEIREIDSIMSVLNSELSNKRSGIENQIEDLSCRSKILTRSLSEMMDNHSQINRKIALLKVECTELEMISSKKSELSIAEEKASYLTEKENDLIKELQKMDLEKTSLIAGMGLRIQSLRNDYDSVIQSIDSKIDERLTKALATIREHEFKIDSLNKKQNEISSTILNERLKVIEIDKLRAEISELGKKKKAIDAEISEWNYLQYACSKKGLQILEIDGVTPLIVRDANEILHKSFGGEFTLKIVTKDEDTGMEVFQIWVIRHDGQEVLIENLSGGQKVWCLKALRLAMTLISKDKSRKHLLTAFADEEDGALDEEKAAGFIRLYRAFMTEGGFETCLFISHRPDVISMADHRLQFTENGICVE